MPKSTCQACKRTVLMVPIAGELVATDPELINVVPATHVTGDGSGGIRMSQRTTPARRLHVERCSDYVEQARREKLAREQREYNRQNGRQPRRNSGL